MRQLRQFAALISLCRDEIVLTVKSSKYTPMKKNILILSVALLSGCSGGSSGDGMVIEGQLIQGAKVAHSAPLFRHGAGESIGEVEICALGECSITDTDGRWGFVANETFNGGDVEFSIKGHGIDGTKIVSIPAGANEVFVVFEHGTGNEIDVETLTVDNKEVEHEHDEDGDHEH